ncbi:MAG: hypothetical protein WD738_04280 [Pirellulales bacterium]
MSRRKPVDNSTAVSLFPFLAVLLCTMGALLVVLVAVSRAAREAALRQATEQQTAAVEADPALLRELEKIDQYSANLKQLRTEAEQHLREDQLRLGHLENHMRRLQDQLSLLQAAALELDAMEEEHYDDREQAQREIERLERLIAETREEVKTVKEQLKSEKRTYALIPYEGPNGTFRRPIYIECCKDALILQPEGVRITRDDLYPPFGAGNPLASALRAARDYFVRLHPQEGQSRDTEPYPLIVVRPEGLHMYDRARRAIESSDMEFGFELAEADWELKYPVADPQLASIEQQAIDQARIRQQALAAAAPRAYRHPALAAAGRFEVEDAGEAGFGFSDVSEGDEGGAGGGQLGADGNEPGAGTGPGTGGTAAQGSTDGEQPAAGGSFGDRGGPTVADDAETSRLAGEQGTGDEAAPGNATQAPGANAMAGGAAATSAPAGNSAGAGGGSGGDSAMDPNAGQQAVVSTGTPPQDPPEDLQPHVAAAPRGRDWALDRKKPAAVPIRRTIQVIVRDDHVAILAEDAQSNKAAPRGKRVEIQGDTVESLDKVVAAVREHIEAWGIAGDGLYWRPVLILNVGPDGERRADDLTRLLKGSGLELRRGNVASKQPQGESRETR